MASASIPGSAPITLVPAGVLIRELASSDRAAIAFAFGRLGEQSRYQRFLAVKPRLSERELDRLTAVDHWHHEALIAWSPPPRAPIAVARYVREADFEAAEVAIVVADDWQRRGVGRALLLALRERAMRAGVRRFNAVTLTGNLGARAVARQCGPVEVAALTTVCSSCRSASADRTARVARCRPSPLALIRRYYHRCMILGCPGLPRP